MNKTSKKVKSYEEYVDKLKEKFGDEDLMPNNFELQMFVDDNYLYQDWGIVVADVKADIRTLILFRNRSRGSKKPKKISSYKNYLEKLKDTFGIPELMPEKSEISQFIDEYNLDNVWGITVEDVSKDLQSFIDGKYPEMYKGASLVKPRVIRAGSRPLPPPAGSNAPSITNTLHKTPSKKQEVSAVPRSEEKTRKKPLPKEKPRVSEYIMVDGDNNVKEGLKGIENLTDDQTVIVVFSQPGAQRKFDVNYSAGNVTSKLVKPGNQAVDNQIKTDIGQLLKNKNQNVTIISHDKDFIIFANKKNNNSDGNHVSVKKSIKDVKKRKK